MARLYVGKLPDNITKDDIEATFKPYGDIKDIWLARNPPGFAFVEFGDKSSGDRAVMALNNQPMLGTTLRVEAASSKPRSGGGAASSDRSGAPLPRGRRSPPYSRGRYYDRYPGPSYGAAAGGGYAPPPPPPSNYYYDYPYGRPPVRHYDRYYGGRDYYGDSAGGYDRDGGYGRPPPPPPPPSRPYDDAYARPVSANATPIGGYAPSGGGTAESMLNPPGVGGGSSGSVLPPSVAPVAPPPAATIAAPLAAPAVGAPVAGSVAAPAAGLLAAPGVAAPAVAPVAAPLVAAPISAPAPASNLPPVQLPEVTAPAPATDQEPYRSRSPLPEKSGYQHQPVAAAVTAPDVGAAPAAVAPAESATSANEGQV